MDAGGRAEDERRRVPSCFFALRSRTPVGAAARSVRTRQDEDEDEDEEGDAKCDLCAQRPWATSVVDARRRWPNNVLLVSFTGD